MQRREFINVMAGGAAAALLLGCRTPPRLDSRQAGRRVLVVAFDGLDPRIVESLIAAGRMPNFARLAKAGAMTRIATSNPPQTPVAFANIISGADPGLHQVYDFIHRDANPVDTGLPVRPYFSTADAASSPRWTIPLGSWQLPLSGGVMQLLRRGPAFWDYLVEHGVDTQIYYLPSNYPPKQPDGPGRFRMTSGMGTPDLLGSYGEFTLLTPDAPRQGRSVGGGRFVFLSMLGNRGRAELVGPPNFLRRPAADGTGDAVEPMKLTLELVRDVDHRVAKIRLGGTTVLLNEGEWSGWVPVEFFTGIPGGSVIGAVGAPTSLRGMVRLFLKQVFPKFELYVSPINIDPLQPINPISIPAEWAGELARRHGRFYTIGIPEDTKALSLGALDEDQFQAQCELAQQERIAQYRQALSEFTSGCLFFYFGATDLLQHMFWRDRDERHPGRVPEQAARYGHVIDELYASTDQLVGDALAAIGPNDLLIVLSDHGFTSFRRQFNLNTWLRDEGFLRQSASSGGAHDAMFPGVDWSATQAYALGMNGLYVNAAGREKHGIVNDAARRSLLAEIRDKLLEVHDEDGTPVVTKVKLTDELYPTADPLVAPDMIIGYNDGYRASWDTVLGGITPKLLEDNLDRWSGEHLIDPDLVPGVMLANRSVTAPSPKVSDVAPTILAAFGIAKPRQMTGRDLFSAPP